MHKSCPLPDSPTPTTLALCSRHFLWNSSAPTHLQFLLLGIPDTYIPQPTPDANLTTRLKSLPSSSSRIMAKLLILELRVSHECSIHVFQLYIYMSLQTLATWSSSFLPRRGLNALHFYTLLSFLTINCLKCPTFPKVFHDHTVVSLSFTRRSKALLPQGIILFSLQ